MFWKTLCFRANNDNIYKINNSSINYRPIALTTIISKMFESVILLKCAEYLSTSDNQFGFKSHHSTDICIYSLKELLIITKLERPQCM